jgi:hypothetical protein
MELPIIELRQYTLRPGMRDRLIELFDREFVETQEAVGIKVLGQFRDTDRPDRFVWLRGFLDMEQRRRALTAFYVDGEAWKTHRDAARATMVDTTDALLLRPARPGSGFPADGGSRPPRAAVALPPTRLIAGVHANGDAARIERSLRPILDQLGASLKAVLVSDHSPNTYPALPVREGENVVVWIAGASDQAAADRLRERMAADQLLSLAPTARSALC